MTKELRQGLGLLAVASLLALLWAVVETRIFGAAALVVALGGLVLVAWGLLSPRNV